MEPLEIWTDQHRHRRRFEAARALQYLLAGRSRMHRDEHIEVDPDDIIEVAECIEATAAERTDPTLPSIRMMGVHGARGPQELDAQSCLDLGVAYRQLGQLGSAIRQFRRALALAERPAHCHLMIALCLLDQDRVDEAVAELKDGLYHEQVTEREALAIQYELALAYERLGDLKEALCYYRRVQRLSPRFRNAAARLARLTFRLRPAPRSRPAPTGSERRQETWYTTGLGRLALQPTG